MPRSVASAAVTALFLVALLPTMAAASGASSPARTAPGQVLTLYAGHAPASTPRLHIPQQAVSATERHSLTASSTISVTYHGFDNQPKAKAAFQAAVNEWQSVLVSSQVIHVNAYWQNLGNPNILGQAGATAEVNGGDGFWYPVALAEARCSCEVNSGDAEIEAYFNSGFTDWYKGTDGNVPNSEWDLETVVLHELGHGLGFYSSFSVQSDNKGYRHTSRVLRFDANEWDKASGGNPMTSYASASTALRVQLTDGSVYLGGSHVEAVLGGRAKLYAPSPWEPGSSNSHLDEARYGFGSVNGLMTPVLNNGESIHDPGPATEAIFQDIGWTIAGSSTDTTPPTVEAPTVTITAAQKMRASVNVLVSWPAATDDSGIASYDLQREDGAGPWTAVTLSTPTSTSAQVAVTRGSNTAFRVRATDGAHNTGPWTSTPSASMSTLQETSGSVAYSGGWTHAALSGASGGSVDRSSTTAATATFTFSGTNVALVTARGASRGIAQITLDGDDKGTVDLFSATTKTKRVAWASAALAPGSHTLVVRVTGTKNPSATGTRVDVDAFLVWP